jgi:hypothetical protein
MKRPFTLIPSTESEDTGRCVEALQVGVRAKKLIGLAYVAIYSQRNYEVHLCGEADRSPTFTRGAVAVLDDKLQARIHGHT